MTESTLILDRPPRPSPTPSPPRWRRIVPPAAWTALTGACYLLSEFGEKVAVPAPQLVIPLLVGAVLALTGTVDRNLPSTAVRGSQAIVGVLMGSYLDPAALRAVAGTALTLTGVTVLTIVICVAVAALLARTARIGQVDATLGLIPGGSAAIVACADELGADSRLVAFTQYLRVGLVALTAPLIVTAVRGPVAAPAGPGAFPTLAHLVHTPRQVAGLILLTGVCFLGVQAGRRLSLPAPALLGPMLLTALVLVTDTSHEFIPAGPLRDLAFVLVGLEVGLRFSRTSLRHIRRLLPYLIGATALVCLICAGLAWAFSAAVGMPFLDAYLATTPGGINAVLATAASAGGSVAVISTVQSLRLFVVVLLTPPLLRWATGGYRRSRRPGPVAGPKPARRERAVPSR
jgi:membrane AbrB-like protein